jgi:hypothetical protein
MWHHNVESLAYHDLDGRAGFNLAVQEVAGRFFLYVARFWHSSWTVVASAEWSEHERNLIARGNWDRLRAGLVR